MQAAFPQVKPLLILLFFVQQTDDKGVFSTTLSQEYAIVAETFKLTRNQMWQLSHGSIDQIFEEDSVKQKLEGLWEKEKRRVLGS